MWLGGGGKVMGVMRGAFGGGDGCLGDSSCESIHRCAGRKLGVALLGYLQRMFAPIFAFNL